SLCDFEGQAGLASAHEPGQGDQARSVQELLYEPRHLGLTSKKPGEAWWECGRRWRYEGSAARKHEIRFPPGAQFCGKTVALLSRAFVELRQPFAGSNHPVLVEAGQKLPAVQLEGPVQRRQPRRRIRDLTRSLQRIHKLRDVGRE